MFREGGGLLNPPNPPEHAHEQFYLKEIIHILCLKFVQIFFCFIQYLNLVFKDINECASSPCQHEGICTTEYVGNYTCNCKIGYEGENCETGENKQNLVLL